MSVSAELVSLQLPASLYEKIQMLATEEHTDPVGIITGLISDAYQQRGWLKDLTALRQRIQDEGGSQIASTKEQVVTQLRQTRQELFDAEYAHLYR